MAAQIQVTAEADGTFAVEIREGGGVSRHRVTVDPDDAARLTQGRVDTATLVRRSFEFLLEREPKEAILARFDLPVIGRYFPEYEAEMRRRLG